VFLITLDEGLVGYLKNVSVHAEMEVKTTGRASKEVLPALMNTAPTSQNQDD
jgi:hypothetical protein